MWGLVLLLGLPVALVLVLWNWVLVADDALSNPAASFISWPVACSTRGCITTKTWQEHYQARQSFASAAEQEAPKPHEALTTLLRQHLIRHAFLRTPVTTRDAVRYREEILGVKEEEQVVQATGLTLEEYDELVILPLLQQEALKQQNSVESNDELYQMLAKERLLIVLPWGLGWNSEQAAVTPR